MNSRCHIRESQRRGVICFNQLKHLLEPQYFSAVIRWFGGLIRAMLVNLTQELKQAAQRDQLISRALIMQSTEHGRNGMANG